MHALPRLEGKRKSGAICNSYFFPSPKVIRETRKLPYRFIIPAGRHGNKVSGAANVDARGKGVGDGQGSPGFARFKADRAIVIVIAS